MLSTKSLNFAAVCLASIAQVALADQPVECKFQQDVL